MKISSFFQTLLLSLLVLFSSTSFAKKYKTNRVIGQVVVPNKNLNLPYKYYLTVQTSDGKLQAYPLKSESVNLKLLYKNFYYYLDVYPTTEEHIIGEKTQKIHVMNIVKAKPFTMKDLGLKTADGKNIDPINEKQPMPVNKDGTPKRGPDFRVNDKVTNSLIFAAGATLLYSILAN